MEMNPVQGTTNAPFVINITQNNSNTKVIDIQQWVSALQRVQKQMDDFISKITTDPKEINLENLQNLLKQEMAEIENLNQKVSDHLQTINSSWFGSMKGKITVIVLAGLNVCCILATATSSLYQVLYDNSNKAQQKANIGLGVSTVAFTVGTAVASYLFKRKKNAKKEMDHFSTKEVEQIRNLLATVNAAQNVKEAADNFNKRSQSEIKMTEDSESDLKAKFRACVLQAVELTKLHPKNPGKLGWTKTIAKLLPNDTTLCQTINKMHGKLVSRHMDHLNGNSSHLKSRAINIQEISFEGAATNNQQPTQGNLERSRSEVENEFNWQIIDEWTGGGLEFLEFDSTRIKRNGELEVVLQPPPNNVTH